MVISKVAEHLTRLGIGARVHAGPAVAGGAHLDAIIEVDVGGTPAVFAAEYRARAPFPNELAKLEEVRHRIASFGVPLLVVPFVSPSLGDRLRESGWSWVDAEGNVDLRAPGVVVAQRRTMVRTQRGRTRLPRGAGSAALIRLMIGWHRDSPLPRATDLADRIGISQPRVSQIMSSLSSLGLASKSEGDWNVADRDALLDRVVAEYDGWPGSTQHLYTLDSMLAVSERTAGLQANISVSADVGPDLIAPWRRPSVVVLYTEEIVDPAELGAVEAEGPDAANVLVRYTPNGLAGYAMEEFDDVPVNPWPRLVARPRADGPEVSLADPTQMLCDLVELGGSDRQEAAGVLREWILSRP